MNISLNVLIKCKIKVHDSSKPSFMTLFDLRIWFQDFYKYLYSSLRESKSLLYHRGKFTDSSSLLSQDILSPGGQNNDLSSDWSNTHFYTTVTIFC